MFPGATSGTLCYDPEPCCDSWAILSAFFRSTATAASWKVASTTGGFGLCASAGREPCNLSHEWINPNRQSNERPSKSPSWLNTGRASSSVGLCSVSSSPFRTESLDAPRQGAVFPTVERFLDGLLKARSQSTRNRYRTLLHAMLNRAMRHGRLTANAVQGVGKFREPEGRTLYLTAEEEIAVREALSPESMRTGRATQDERRTDPRPLFTVSVNTGLRWSEQRALRWAEVDFLTGLITVRHSKSGYSRQVPMNSLVRSVLMDLASQRRRTDDPEEPVFRCSYTSADEFFPKAVERARKALGDAGKDGSRLDGYTWHCNRHTFASRLVMAGVDLRSVQTLGGWRTLAMVQRYSHLAPAHLLEAVERLVPAGAAVELSRNYPNGEASRAGVS